MEDKGGRANRETKQGYYWGLGVLVEEGRWNVKYLREPFRAH